MSTGPPLNLNLYGPHFLRAVYSRIRSSLPHCILCWRRDGYLSPTLGLGKNFVDDVRHNFGAHVLHFVELFRR